MQDRYAGDIGDFGKFYLLRKLFDSTKYQIGVVWYLFPNEDYNSDGLHIGYLCSEEYKRYDGELIEKLTNVVKEICDRSVSLLENQHVLPENTVFYSEYLKCYEKNQESKNREESRCEWLSGALSKVSDCNVIFLDPDNGLEVKSVKSKARKTAGKYVFYDEVINFFKNENIKVCMIYHHLSRNGTHDKQMKYRIKELCERLSEKGSSEYTIFAIRFKPFSPRAFFIIAKKSEASNIENKIGIFIIEANSDKSELKWDLYIKKECN